MTVEDIAALSLFAFVATITPGPNNLMLFANAANFGLRRAIPQMLGVPSGIAVMILLLGIGLEELYDAVPWFHWVLKVLGSGYLLWLAAKIAFTRQAFDHLEARGRPFRFYEAFVFQVVNPKSWTMVIASLAFLSSKDDWHEISMISGIFFCFSLLGAVIWVSAGSVIAQALSDPVRLRAVNVLLGAMLALSSFHSFALRV